MSNSCYSVKPITNLSTAANNTYTFFIKAVKDPIIFSGMP